MVMTDYFNRVQAKDIRRALRQTETAAEALVWDRLRDRRLSGLKFRRQYSVGVYILDFYCPASCLAVELDGESHASPEAQEYDAERTEFVSTLNIRVLRFPNAAVYQDIHSVIRNSEGIHFILTFYCPILSSPSPLCLRHYCVSEGEGMLNGITAFRRGTRRSVRSLADRVRSP